MKTTTGFVASASCAVCCASCDGPISTSTYSLHKDCKCPTSVSRNASSLVFTPSSSRTHQQNPVEP